jgi:hypothetical protein
VPWIRSGECCRCGQCCLGDPFPDKPLDNPRCSHLMRTREPEQPDRCPLLTFHVGAPQGDTSCLGHTGMPAPHGDDPYYLAGCNEWPTHPDHIKDYDRCTYSFTWQDD